MKYTKEQLATLYVFQRYNTRKSKPILAIDFSSDLHEFLNYKEDKHMFAIQFAQDNGWIEDNNRYITCELLNYQHTFS